MAGKKKTRRTRGSYDPGVKLAVARLIVDEKLGASFVASELKLSIPTVSLWAKQYRKDGEGAFKEKLSPNARKLLTEAKQKLRHK